MVEWFRTYHEDMIGHTDRLQTDGKTDRVIQIYPAPPPYLCVCVCVWGGGL